jgi:hypothetical protein
LRFTASGFAWFQGVFHCFRGFLVSIKALAKRFGDDCKTVYTSSILVVASINPIKHLAADSEVAAEA